MEGKSPAVTVIGYTMMCEQAGPKELVRDAQLAETAGFEFAVISDHYFPWVDAMGHSPYAWSVLGAAAQATSRIELMTYVTCPIKRYHPAVVAQKAATVGLALRRTVHARRRSRREPQRAHHRRGMAAGQCTSPDAERSGRDHPGPLGRRLRELLRPSLPGRLGQAVGPARPAPQAGDRRVRVSNPLGWPGRTPTASSRSSRLRRSLPPLTPPAGRGKPRVGQLPISYDRDRDTAIKRALELFGWFGGGWKVNSELPGTAAFEGRLRLRASRRHRRSIPCGDSVDAVVTAVNEFANAGFTHVALCQIGGDPKPSSSSGGGGTSDPPSVHEKEEAVPQSAWSPKRERQYEHIEGRPGGPRPGPQSGEGDRLSYRQQGTGPCRRSTTSEQDLDRRHLVGEAEEGCAPIAAAGAARGTSCTKKPSVARSRAVQDVQGTTRVSPGRPLRPERTDLAGYRPFPTPTGVKPKPGRPACGGVTRGQGAADRKGPRPRRCWSARFLDLRVGGEVSGSLRPPPANPV